MLKKKPLYEVPTKIIEQKEKYYGLELWENSEKGRALREKAFKKYKITC